MNQGRSPPPPPPKKKIGKNMIFHMKYPKHFRILIFRIEWKLIFNQKKKKKTHTKPIFVFSPDLTNPCARGGMGIGGVCEYILQTTYHLKC